MNTGSVTSQQAQLGKTVGEYAHAGNMHNVNAANANQDADKAVYQASYQAASKAANQMAKADHAGNAVRAVDAEGASKPVVVGLAYQKAGEHAGDMSYSDKADDTAAMNEKAAANQFKPVQYDSSMKQAHEMAQTDSQALANAMNSAIFKRRLCSMYKAGSLSYIDCLNNVDAVQYTDSGNQAGGMDEANTMQQAEVMRQAKAMNHAYVDKTGKPKTDAMYQANWMGENQAANAEA